jgi:hypothetical protein
MMMTERRQSPRMKVEGLAYVTLDADNGGIVSDISEGGLSFRSTAPVMKTAKIRFWFSQRRRQMEADNGMDCTRFLEADSELAWTDGTRKRGGLRFTNLAKEDREEIRAWINQHSSPVTVQKQVAPYPPPARESNFVGANRRDASSALYRPEAFKRAFAKLIPAKPFSGFFGGLAAGVLFSAVAAAGILVHNHSREIGDSIIQFGERVGGRAKAQQESSPTTKPEAAEAKPLAAETGASPAVMPATIQKDSAVRNRVSEPEPPATKPTEATAKPADIKLATSPQVVPATVALANPNPSGTSAGNSPTSAPSVPPISAEIPANSRSEIFRPTAPRGESTRQPEVHVEASKVDSSGPPPEDYMEVGKFNDKLQTDTATNKLSQVGLPFVVVTKNFFWKKSYQVLAGPYGSEQEANAAHAKLTSHGFTVRPFEKGKREVTLYTPMTLGSKSVPVGPCVISWESYVPSAVVKIEGRGGETVILEGRLVNRAEKYNNNSVVYMRNMDGSRTLEEFRFSGMRQALVFGTRGPAQSASN